MLLYGLVIITSLFPNYAGAVCVFSLQVQDANIARLA